MHRIDRHATARWLNFLCVMSLAIATVSLPCLSAAQANPPAPINWGTPGAGGLRTPSAVPALGNPSAANSALGARLGNASTQVPAPSNLHRSADVQECRAHGQIDCSQLNYPTYVLLVWNADPAATAYHLYRAGTGAPQLLAAVQPQPSMGATSAALPSAFGIPNVSVGSCYAITESKGNIEGPMSATWCMPNTLGAAAATNSFTAAPVAATPAAPVAAPPIANRWGTPASGTALGGISPGNQRPTWTPGPLVTAAGQPAGAAAVAAMVAPTGLTRATEMPDCTQHLGRAGGPMCAQISKPNYVLLIWNGVNNATGYKLYRTDGGKKVSAGAVSEEGGFLATGFGFADVPIGTCFAVSAVINNAEGVSSTAWCLQANLITAGAGAPAPGKNIASATTPATPTQLHTTTSAQECTEHQGNFICAALQGGAQTLTVLVWTGEKAAQKYTVYQIPSDQKRSSVVAIGSNTGTINGIISTAYSVDKVAAGTCFAVTETIDGHESSQSAAACPGASAQSTTLLPVQVQSYGSTQEIQCTAYTILSKFSGTVNQPGRQPGLMVGYNSVSTPCRGDFNSTGVVVDNYFYRGGIFFDLTSFAGRKVMRAMLILPVASAQGSNGGMTSCVSSVSTGASQWWTDVGQINPGITSVDATQLAGEVDVTSMVNAWLLGAPRGGADNDGFVLLGQNESLGGMSGGCLTTYGNPTLVLTAQ